MIIDHESRHQIKYYNMIDFSYYYTYGFITVLVPSPEGNLHIIEYSDESLV